MDENAVNQLVLAHNVFHSPLTKLHYPFYWIIYLQVVGLIKGVTDFGDIHMRKFFMFSKSCAGGENTLAEWKNRQGWVKCIPSNVIFSLIY